MSTYTIAEAKERLPNLIDEAAEGGEVVITRDGKPVAELRPVRRVDHAAADAAYERLRAARERGPKLSISSVELLRQMYKDE
jgi:prevent-host-death family protein